MAHWPHEPERESGDGHDETFDDVVNARKFLRRAADVSTNPVVRGMMGDLRQIEMMAGPFFLAFDFDGEDRDDVDEMVFDGFAPPQPPTLLDRALALAAAAKIETVTCRCCGATKLHWRPVGDKWRLYDRNGIHRCPKNPLKE